MQRLNESGSADKCEAPSVEKSEQAEMYEKHWRQCIFQCISANMSGNVLNAIGSAILKHATAGSGGGRLDEDAQMYCFKLKYQNSFVSNILNKKALGSGSELQNACT